MSTITSFDQTGGRYCNLLGHPVYAHDCAAWAPASPVHAAVVDLAAENTRLRELLADTARSVHRFAQHTEERGITVPLWAAALWDEVVGSVARIDAELGK